jgi:protein SCO1
MTRIAAMLMMWLSIAVQQANGANDVWAKRGPEIPAVNLIDQDGKSWQLTDLIHSRPVIINFFFSGCRTVCPVQTAMMQKVMDRLANQTGGEEKPIFLSISLDPLGDTPDTIRGFIKQFGIKAGTSENWLFLSGTFEELEPVWRAFDQPVNDAGQHDQMLWIGQPQKGRWTRASALVPDVELAKLVLDQGE